MPKDTKQWQRPRQCKWSRLENRVVSSRKVINVVFVFLCKSKEDYEEEDVEEVVYKDSSHFLKVTFLVEGTDVPPSSPTKERDLACSHLCDLCPKVCGLVFRHKHALRTSAKREILF